MEKVLIKTNPIY